MRLAVLTLALVGAAGVASAQQAPPVCVITVTTAPGAELRATYNTPRRCGVWPPMWFSTSAQVHVLPKGGGYRVKVSGPPGMHLVRAVLPGVAHGGAWVQLGPF